MIYRLKEFKGDTIPVPQLVFSKLGIAEEYNVRVALYVLATGITDPEKLCADLKLRSKMTAESALSFWAGAGLLERYEENAAPGEEPSAPAPMTWAEIAAVAGVGLFLYKGPASRSPALCMFLLAVLLACAKPVDARKGRKLTAGLCAAMGVVLWVPPLACGGVALCGFGVMAAAMRFNVWFFARLQAQYRAGCRQRHHGG